MAATTTIHVPHLGGITVGYKLSSPSSTTKIDPSLPTAVLINSMCTTVSLYDTQFSSTALTTRMNLLAIEPLGHGATSCTKTEHWTYWDSAIMALQVMDLLGVEKAFLLGTSQGGWIVMRVGIVAPERILGIMILGTSLTHESTLSRTLGCWDPSPILTPFIHSWTSSVPTPDFAVDDVWCGMVGGIGFGSSGTPELMRFWTQTLKSVYKGDEGRRKLRMAVMCLLERDGLLLRLGDVRAPVRWLQGSEDSVYGTTMSEMHSKLFTSSKEVKYSVVEGGAHYLNATNPEEVNSALLEMVERYE